MNNTKTVGNQTDGRIIKSPGSNFTVLTQNGLVNCKARGIFRKYGITPVAGDLVKMSNAQGEDGVIAEILPRKNSLTRPPCANIDSIIFVVSTVAPPPNLFILDKFITVAAFKHIDTAIAVTKTDLAANPKIKRIYEPVVSKIFEIDYNHPSTLDGIKDFLNSKITIFTGNSGVGKSTLLNALMPEIAAATNEISVKLGRGKHTTRCVELYPYGTGFVGDSPGFSTFETAKYDNITREELPYCFKEFIPYLETPCRFASCTHTKETGCNIFRHVLNGDISPSRFESYKKIFEETPRTKTAFNKPK
ncbi:MAG: ribosome small subunit-dependent GTPase A [Ruminococcus sp.]|nr:ribosome small subunit-dependent GTPase A [Ruminococcus sp.]